jgi:hypothetical protein
MIVQSIAFATFVILCPSTEIVDRLQNHDVDLPTLTTMATVFKHGDDNECLVSTEKPVPTILLRSINGEMHWWQTEM